MSDERWIVVRNWERFQHYGDRSPLWIKNYVALLTDDDYLALPEGARAVLHGLWLAYASSDGRLRLDTRSLSRRLALRVTTAQLKRLNDAGFIAVVASKPLALTRARARWREKSKNKNYPYTREAGVDKSLTEELTPRQRGTNPRAAGTNPRALGVSPRQLARYTGCRLTHGSHGTGYVRSVLGTDKPPADWPWPRPTRAELVAALAAERGAPDDDVGAGDTDDREHEQGVDEDDAEIDSSPASFAHHADDTLRRHVPHVELREMP
jgi:hypothetical protein